MIRCGCERVVGARRRGAFELARRRSGKERRERRRRTDRPNRSRDAFDSVDAARRLDERPRRDAIERSHDAVRRSRLVDASGGRARETTDGGERTDRE